jgi:hypothetical protein
VQSEHFLLVALAAEKFACRPSQMVGLEDSVLALDFDLAAAARLIERERAALAEIRRDPEEGAFADTGRTREERW